MSDSINNNVSMSGTASVSADSQNNKPATDKTIELAENKVSIVKLITHTNIDDQGSYAHNEIMLNSVFRHTKQDNRFSFTVYRKPIKEGTNKGYVYFLKKQVKNNEPEILQLTDNSLKQIHKAIDNYCKILYDYKSEINTTDLAPENNEGYVHLAFSDYKLHKRKLDYKENKTIYRIGKYNTYNGEHYFIETGLYSGVINFGKKNKIEIRTLYSDELFRRMLLRCCGIYADTKTSGESSVADESIYSLLAQYLYLVSLRKVMGKIVPRKYMYLKERGYSIRGNIDINAYVNRDISMFDKKITYSYPEQVEIRRVLDVLYAALNRCKITEKNSVLPNLVNFESFLRENSTGKKPSRHVINNIDKEPFLQNSLYSDFKKPLRLAKLLLKDDDLSPDDMKGDSGISGYLVDSSFLWEMYLYGLMTNKLENWTVSDQEPLKLYRGKFYRRSNYPDFVLFNREKNQICILDAKFKSMGFNPYDLDREDFFQIHSYAYYYQLKSIYDRSEPRLKGCALVYPTKVDPPDTTAPMFGLENAKERFSVITLKDVPNDLEKSENDFIMTLQTFLDNDN